MSPFYRGSLWAACIGLPAALLWWVLDPKGDVHLIDRGVRALDALREVARI